MKSGRKVLKLAAEVSPEFNEEKIHKIRTTIKKIRAVGAWAGIPVKKFFKQNYQLLGKIRDTQLLLKKSSDGEFNLPQDFSDWLLSSLHHLKVNWQETYDEKNVKKEYRKLLKLVDDHSHDKKHSVKFEEEKNKKLQLLIQQRPLNDSDLHAGRKTIKEIDFLNKWEKNSSDKRMKQLSEETGDFTDTISAIMLLGQYISEEKKVEVKNEANELLEKWKLKKEKEKKKILKSIDSLYG